MEIAYTPSFIRDLEKIETDLYEEVLEKIELFKDKKNHKQLKVHKLKGKLNKSYSFSVDYKNRIVFDMMSDGTALLHTFGDHDVYK